MDKLTAIKIKYDDGTYSNEIPVSALAKNVEWDSTHTLVDILGSIDVGVTGTIQDQISQLFNEKISNSDMQTYISSSMPSYITNWLNTKVDPVGSAVVVDKSLSISGAAADAKVVGDEISDLKNELSDNGAMSSNLIGLQGCVLYPVNIKAGSIFCISTADGSDNQTPGLWLNLYNANKENVQSLEFRTGSSSRYARASHDTAFVAWNISPSNIVMMNIGQVPIPYTEYYENTRYLYKDLMHIENELELAKPKLEFVREIESTLENGYINASSYIAGRRNKAAELVKDTTRCTTDMVYELSKNDVISIKNIDSDIKIAITGSANGSFIYDSGWKTTDFFYTVKEPGIYFVNIAYSDGTTAILPDNISTLCIEITKYSFLHNIGTDVANYRYTIGNLMHAGNTVPGYINASGWKSSTVNPTNLERVTDFIPINNGDEYVVFLSIPKTGTITICVSYYSSAVDGNSAFIERQLVQTGETKNDEKYEFVSITVDSEQKKYMRITVNTYGKNNYYLFNVTNGIPIGLKALYCYYQSATATDIQIDTQIAQTFADLQRTTSKLENFMYFTDPHLLIGDSVWMKTTDDYLKILSAYYTACPVTMTLCGGDWLNYEKPVNTFELCYMRRKTDTMLSPFYNVVGNHDLYSGSSLYSAGELQNILFPTREHCYYTFNGINTRFYALDTGMDSAKYAAMTEYRWEQIAWLGNALKTDDKQNSMILMHIYSDDASDHTNITPFAENVVAICAAYNNRNTVMLNGAEYDFTNCTGKMRLIICGHNHQDYNLTNSGIPVVCTRNTKNDGPSFDLCCVNYGENKIHMVRVGGGSDRTINLAT